MTTDRTVTLTPQELALKIACDDAVRAAGGQVFVAREAGRSQSEISDMCSQNTRRFMPLNVALLVDRLGAGNAGHPHITRAINRALGQLAYEADPVPLGDFPLSRWLAELAGESSDLIRSLAECEISGTLDARNSIAAMPAARKAQVGGELDQLIAVLIALNEELHQPAPDSS